MKRVLYLLVLLQCVWSAKRGHFERRPREPVVGPPTKKPTKPLIPRPRFIKPIGPRRPRILMGGWFDSSVKSMYKRLSNWNYNDKQLMAMKEEKDKYKSKKAWILDFLGKLDVSRRATKAMRKLKRKKIVKIFKVRQQTVAGFNYKIYVRLSNGRKRVVGIFVPLPSRGGNPVIRYVNRIRRRRHRYVRHRYGRRHHRFGRRHYSLYGR